MGIVAEPGAGNTIAGLAELNDAFTKALGLKVEFFVARSYPALIDAQASSRIEYAIYSASAYASAYQRCECVEPLVAPTGEDGSIGIRSVLIAKDGRLPFARRSCRTPHRAAAADSIAGYQLPLAAFQPGGKPLSGAETFSSRHESAEAAEAMLAEGSVDAIFGWTPAAPPGAPEIEGGTLARLEAAGVDRATLSIVWRSDVLRYGPHAVSSGLDPEPKRRLTAFLTGLREADPDMYERLEMHRLGGFIAASQADYAAALDMVRMLAEARPRRSSRPIHGSSRAWVGCHCSLSRTARANSSKSEPVFTTDIRIGSRNSSNS